MILFDTRQLDWRPWWPGAGVRTVTVSRVVASDVSGVIADLRGRLT